MTYQSPPRWQKGAFMHIKVSYKFNPSPYPYIMKNGSLTRLIPAQTGKFQGDSDIVEAEIVK
jgi:hypothetical protein